MDDMQIANKNMCILNQSFHAFHCRCKSKIHVPKIHIVNQLVDFENSEQLTREQTTGNILSKTPIGCLAQYITFTYNWLFSTICNIYIHICRIWLAQLFLSQCVKHITDNMYVHTFLVIPKYKLRYGCSYNPIIFVKSFVFPGLFGYEYET